MGVSSTLAWAGGRVARCHLPSTALHRGPRSVILHARAGGRALEDACSLRRILRGGASAAR